MELQQLQHFLAAVKCKTIRKAAEQENITQSGLSRSIIALEEYLGAPLLTRSAGGVAATPYGEALIEHAKSILNQRKRAIDSIAGLKEGKSGSVDLGVTRNFTHYFAPEVISSILEKSPELRLSIQTGSFRELAGQLSLGNLDLIFGLVDAAYQNPKIRVETLFLTRSIIIARPSHPIFERTATTTEILAAARWAMLEGPGIQAAFTTFFYQRKHRAPGQVIRTNSLAFLKNIVSACDLLTILPYDYVIEDLKSNALRQVQHETPADFAYAGLAFATNAAATPAMDIVAAEFRKFASTE